MDVGSRFLTPASDLSLALLRRKAKLAVLVSLVVSLVGHVLLSKLVVFRSERAAAKPLTTQFIKRQPRLSKPLELKKLPRPRRRQMRRTMVSVKARVERGGRMASVRSPRLLQSLARPVVSVARAASGETPQMEMQALAGRIVGAKESEHAMDTSLEMLDVDALDTGRYQAMVIQDPSDRRNIKGYVRLAVAFPLSVYHRYGADYNSVDFLVAGLRRLVDKLNQWTDIKASVTKRISFDSAEFFETPWAYVFLNFGFEPTHSEIENLGKYLLTGGFFFFEGNYTGGWNGERYLFQFVTDALESQAHRQGVDWEFESIPNTHPIFHCYYDFANGVPMGGSIVAKYLWDSVRDDGIDPRAKGVHIDGHLLAFNTNQGMLGPWLHWGTTYGDGAYSKYDPTTQFRFGINTIIFALTQEGSITRRVMDSVR